MNRAQRRRHMVMWAVIGPTAGLVMVVAIAARRPVPVQAAALPANPPLSAPAQSRPALPDAPAPDQSR